MKLSAWDTGNSQPHLASELDIELVDGAEESQEDPVQESAVLRLVAEGRLTMFRHHRLVLLWAVAGLLAGILIQLPLQPVYRARVFLQVQSPAFAANHSDTPPSTVSLETHIRLVGSNETLAGVEQGLIEDPQAVPVQRRDWLSRLQRVLQIGGKDSIPLSALIDQSARSMRGWRVGSTPMIEVSCSSWNPEFAAKYCNMLTAEVQREDIQSRGAMATMTSDLLIREAAIVQARLKDAERRQKEKTGRDRYTSPQTAANAGQDLLQHLQAELIKAQAERMARRAQMQAATSSDTSEIADPTAYAASQSRLTKLQIALNEMPSKTRTQDAKRLRLNAEIKRVEAEISAEREAAMQRLQAQYEAAEHREDLLTLSLRTLESRQPPNSQNTPEEQLRQEVANGRQLYQALLEHAREAGFSSAAQTSFVRVVERATTPRSAVYPHRLPFAVAGSAFGACVGLGLAFFKDRNRAVLRLPGESTKLLGVEELGVIPAATKEPLLPHRKAVHPLAPSHTRSPSAALRTARWDQDFSLAAEAYRNAMLSILLAKPERKRQVYIVSSPGTGEGKSTIATNLGVALSKSGLRVVLIDGDLRRPCLHRTLGVPNGLGLRNILRGEVNLESAVSLYCKATVFPKLCVIPAGSGREQIAELFPTMLFGALVERLARDYDIILVDTPPIGPSDDAHILAQNTSGAILVLRSDFTPREDAVRAREVLEQHHVTIIGTILNDFNPSKEGRYDYYGSYYAYEHKIKESPNAGS